MVETQNYDVVVIGGGTAGSNAARAAVEAGAERVLMVHLPDFFNTCLEVGCMPSKSLITSSERGLAFEDAADLMDKHIERLRAGLQEGFEHADFDILKGTAQFTEDRTLAVLDADGASRTVTGKRYVVATGSRSFIPPIDGLDSISKDFYFASDGLVSERHIDHLPQSVFVLGGGPIGLEMMTALTHFGVEVIIAERGAQLLGRLDPEFGREMEKALSLNPKVKLLTSANLIRVDASGQSLALQVERAGAQETHHADKLLLAVGRRPCTESLGLEHMDVALDEKGRIIYDSATLQSKNPDVYVAGDVTGMYQILHYAAVMGRVAGANAANESPHEKVDYDKNNMGVIFSDPQVAHAGLTEVGAREAGIETISAALDLPNIGRGLLEDKKSGIWKMTARKSDGRIIGGQAISALPHSEWFVDTISWIMHFGGTAHDVADKVPYYHPTYPELLQTLGRELVDKL